MIVEIINKKRLGKILSKKELEYFFNGYLHGEIMDYQMSALLMAICIKGMTDKEIFDLTDIFIKSGERFDFPGIEVDKHSTGGVGDKTTLIIAPIVASLGVPVVKMSGRGLGFTGGTIDKLESIPGFRTNLTDDEIEKQKKEIGIVITSQTKDLVPLDKLIYALRDVTGTTESIPLIATSIMSKKIASGADKILIDIKVGNGALIKKEKDAKKLAQLMKKIGEFYHREVRCMTTNMDTPLGTSIGNSLEVIEAINILQNKEDNYLRDLCIELASEMVSMGKDISVEKAKIQVEESIRSGKAYQKFLEFIKYQEGDIQRLEVSNQKIEVRSKRSGLIKKISAEDIGNLSVSLGAGRIDKEDQIDPTVGILLNKGVGDRVLEKEILCTLYVNKEVNIEQVEKIFVIE
ncbi:MAG: thymidine phosphorylase [Bacilli bacterium]|nr:thymidine phosphorylase [Bacilli bacterium]